VTSSTAPGWIWCPSPRTKRKDDLTQPYLAGHDGSEAVLYVGRAQEKAAVMRTVRRFD
jgi:hypothetical protein